ncbi:hypothetical protein OSCI_3400028 [Kamptonema sp. PCC 6506]|nr:hypothetical protein OSCI_3400028 [Kamptonema sp. PCC 6506]
MFRGREIQHSNLAEDLLKRMATVFAGTGEKCSKAPKKEVTEHDDAPISEKISRGCRRHCCVHR